MTSFAGSNWFYNQLGGSSSSRNQGFTAANQGGTTRVTATRFLTDDGSGLLNNSRSNGNMAVFGSGVSPVSFDYSPAPGETMLVDTVNLSVFGVDNSNFLLTLWGTGPALSVGLFPEIRSLGSIVPSPLGNLRIKKRADLDYVGRTSSTLAELPGPSPKEFSVEFYFADGLILADATSDYLRWEVRDDLTATTTSISEMYITVTGSIFKAPEDPPK